MKAIMVLAAMLSCSAWAATQRPRVVVMKSFGDVTYGKVVAGFSSEVKADVEIDEFHIRNQGYRAKQAFAQLAKNPPALLFVVGPKATELAKNTLRQVPVVFAMVPHHELRGLSAPNITGISMAVGSAEALAVLVAARPNAKRVALVHAGSHSADALVSLRIAAKRKGIELVSIPVGSVRDTKALIAKLKAKNVGAVMSLPDRIAASSEIQWAILRYARQKGIATLVPNRSQLGKGALVYVATNPLAIGRQAGQLANKILEKKITPRRAGVIEPLQVDVTVNWPIAKSLGGLSDNLMQLMAKRRYALWLVNEGTR